MEEFQKLIKYKFRDISLLKQALTTPLRGKELNEPHYDVLETIGDAVIKLIFSTKLYEERESDSETITKKKQMIENDPTLSKIASKYFHLEKFIFKSNNQIIENTKILADVFEAICGAIFLDSKKDIVTVQEKIIDVFYKDYNNIVKDSRIFDKNQLLEYLQGIYKFTPTVKTQFEQTGPDHNSRFIATHPKIFNQNNEEIMELPQRMRSNEYKSKKDAEKDLFKKILDYLSNKNL